MREDLDISCQNTDTSNAKHLPPYILTISCLALSQVNIKGELYGVTRNHIVFKCIAWDMGEMEYEFTWLQCEQEPDPKIQKGVYCCCKSTHTSELTV